MGGADRVARWAAVGIGFSIPISVAIDNVLLAAMMLAWLAGGRLRDKWATIRANRGSPNRSRASPSSAEAKREIPAARTRPPGFSTRAASRSARERSAASVR